MVKISILVAVYNGEKYLNECLDSLVSQQLRDIEIICIDDASTDSSLSIIQRYSCKDERIKCIHLSENHGQGFARNEGLKVATGEIVAFLDCDDWLDDDSLLTLYRTFEENSLSDSVLFRCVYEYADHQEEYKGKPFKVKNGQEAFLDSLTWAIHGVYAARMELYKQYPFDCSCRHFSDDNTTRIHYLKSREVRQSDAVYHYRQHDGSVSHVISKSRMDYMAASRSMKKQLEMLGCSNDILNVYENERWKIVVDSYMFYFCNRGSFSKEDRQYCVDSIKTGWESIEWSRLDNKLTSKLGFFPMKNCWALFRLEEEIYFYLKQLFHRL